jgi:hypothetical protein
MEELLKSLVDIIKDETQDISIRKNVSDNLTKIILENKNSLNSYLYKAKFTPIETLPEVPYFRNIKSEPLVNKNVPYSLKIKPPVPPRKRQRQYPSVPPRINAPIFNKSMNKSIQSIFDSEDVFRPRPPTPRPQLPISVPSVPSVPSKNTPQFNTDDCKSWLNFCELEFPYIPLESNIIEPFPSNQNRESGYSSDISSFLSLDLCTDNNTIFSSDEFSSDELTDEDIYFSDNKSYSSEDLLIFNVDITPIKEDLTDSDGDSYDLISLGESVKEKSD